jgi:hypothetical protein
VLAKRKYRILFSRNRRRSPGPKGPQKKLVDAVVELKRRNRNWACPRIAQQITLRTQTAVQLRLSVRAPTIRGPEKAPPVNFDRRAQTQGVYCLRCQEEIFPTGKLRLEEECETWSQSESL